jgi:hypothetical protein
MNRYATTSRILSVLFMIIMAAGFSSAWAAESDTGYTEEDCIQCHRTGSDESDLHMSVDDFKASVHNGQATCQDCHTGVVDDSHQTTKGSGAVDCSGCHDQENNHGAKAQAADRPQCYSCHTKHHILAASDPASTVNPKQIPVTCGQCHAAEAGKDKSYFSWFPGFQIASHPKADFADAYDKDNCMGCHQGAAAHGETEPVNADTCYKCHSPKMDGAMWGTMHPGATKQSKKSVFAVGVVYQIFIGIALIMVVGMFFRKRS